MTTDRPTHADQPEHVRTDQPEHVRTDQPEHVRTTRAFYDAIAEDYAETFRDHPAAAPLDRALLAGFAELVGEGAPVADVGCGPGRVTGFLASRGLAVHGVDLSEAMLAIARRENPGLRFEQGSMFALDLPDGALAGLVSWYSTIHVPPEDLPAVYAEFRRVLAPGGLLLVAFQMGDEPRRHERPWGHPVTLDFRRMRPERIAELMEAAGFTLVQRTVREPDTRQGDPTPQAFLIARAPDGPAS